MSDSLGFDEIGKILVRILRLEKSAVPQDKKDAFDRFTVVEKESPYFVLAVVARCLKKEKFERDFSSDYREVFTAEKYAVLKELGLKVEVSYDEKKGNSGMSRFFACVDESLVQVCDEIYLPDNDRFLSLAVLILFLQQRKVKQLIDHDFILSGVLLQVENLVEVKNRGTTKATVVVK